MNEIFNRSKYLLLLLAISLITSNLTAQKINSRDSLKFAKAADSLILLGAALIKTDLDSAVFFIDQSQVFFLKAKNYENYVACISIKTTIFNDWEEFDQAKSLSYLALEEANKRLGVHHELYGQALNNLAVALRKRGDYDKSIKLLNQSIEIELNRPEGLRKEKLAIKYKNLSVNHALNGNFEKALDLRKRSLDLRLQIYDKNNPILGGSYKDMGKAFNDLNKYDSAHIYYMKSLSNLDKNEFRKSKNVLRNKIIALQGLAKNSFAQNKIQKGHQYLDQVLQLQAGEKAYRKDRTFELLSILHSEEKEFEKALEAIRKSNNLAILNAKSGSYPYIARKFLATAKIFRSLNNLDSALVYSQKALAILAPDYTFRNEFDNPPTDQILAKPDALDIFTEKASLLSESYTKNNEYEILIQSLEASRSAVNLVRNLRQTDLTTKSKNALAEKAVAIYEQAIATALELYKLTKEEKYKVLAFSFAENNKSLLLLEQMNKQMAQGNAGLPDSLMQKEKTFVLDIAYYQKKILEGKQSSSKSKDSKLEDWKNKLFTLQQSYDYYVSQLEENYPRYYQLKYDNNPITIDKLRAGLLDDQSHLVEYFFGEKNIYAFSLTMDDLKVATISNITKISDEINSLRTFVATPPTTGVSKEKYEAFCNSALFLHQQLIRPLKLPRNRQLKKMIIIPDGILAFLPFELLMESVPTIDKIHNFGNLNFLLKQYSTSYGYSATLLHRNRNANEPTGTFNKDFAAFAPSFSGKETALRNCDQDQLSQLSCNQKEVEQIDQLLEGTIAIGQVANVDNFKKEITNSRILHLATHACMDEKDPLLSKVFFSEGNLSLLDFYNLNINTQLVVLSACNTGVGKLLKGEGVMSIAKGFMLSGSPSTMLSLWSVDDCSTSELMEHYYKNLKEGKDKDFSLQAAKIEYLSNASKALSHPFYWAAFEQFGNTKPINWSNSNSIQPWILYTSIGLVVMFLLLAFKKRRRNNGVVSML